MAGTQERRVFFSPPSEEDRYDQRGPNGVKLDGQLRHQQDEHGGGGVDHLHGPQGFFLSLSLEIIKPARI